MIHLRTNARQLAKLLRQKEVCVVFAESCTAGLVAASLAKVPGISEFLCGSAVTYRSATKHQWLGVSSKKLDHPGPVSAVVANEMAEGVLMMTTEAEVSASVTGHLGPHAPPSMDGVIFVGIAQRAKKSKIKVATHRFLLESDTRIKRQQEAASIVIKQLSEAISST